MLPNSSGLLGGCRLCLRLGGVACLAPFLLGFEGRVVLRVVPPRLPSITYELVLFLALLSHDGSTHVTVCFYVNRRLLATGVGDLNVVS